MTEARVTIERLGHLGDGIAPGPMFVPRSLPGEVVEGVVTGARMETPRILIPSSDRIRPACRHYKSCGGCALQHASEAFVAEWKQGVVRTALEAYGISTEFLPIETSPPGSRRRATLSARRTKSGASIGFHAPRSGIITDIPDCLMLHPDLLAALPMVRKLAQAGGSRKGELSVTLTLSDTGIDVAVRGGKPLDRALETELAALAGSGDLARLTWEDEPIAIRHPPAQSFGRARVVPPPGAFLQATAHGEGVLQKGVAKAVGDAARIVDLFSGCGTFTLPLAERAELHAVEAEADMLAALDEGWRQAQGLKKITTEQRDLFHRPLLPEELNRFDAVVIDPPRAGAESQIGEITASDVPVVVMVSCNPVSFARDSALLIGAGFHLDWVQVVDQFRWSPHVEVVARLTR